MIRQTRAIAQKKDSIRRNTVLVKFIQRLTPCLSLNNNLFYRNKTFSGHIFRLFNPH